MAKFFIKALKVLLWLLLLAALGGLTYLFVSWKGWPLWTGSVILLGPIGLVMAVLYVRRHLFRRREKEFVKRIVEQEPDKLVLAQAATREHVLNDLRASFGRAVQVLRQSRLTRWRNPVYALPWFLVAGESGSGKSAALRSADLKSLLTDLNPPGDKPGGQCEWWFQENGVILDVTGRFLDVDADEAAWGEFLVLLARHRRREPISGLVLTVAAERLLGPIDQVVTSARAARRRVDELMRVLGARFPVYLLVTRMDAVPGFDGFCSRLTPEERLQAMGGLNAVAPDMPETRAGEILDATAEALKTLRLVLADRTDGPAGQGGSDPGLARFPDAFMRMEEGLGLYCRELFQKNTYLETPLFRGLFFASARYDRPAEPMETGVLAQFETPAASGVPRSGTFLHDFFARVLPGDRKLHSPLPAFLSWRAVTRFASLGAVLALSLCAAGLFTYSYLRNNAALAYFAATFKESPKLTGDLSRDVDMMHNFRDVLVNMEQENKGWVLPRMGFDESIIAEAKLRQLYCELFRLGVMSQFDALLQEETSSLAPNTPPDLIQRFASYIVNRIRLVESAHKGHVDYRTAGMVYDELSRLVFKGARVDPQFADRYETLHLSYLMWNTDPRGLAQERGALVGYLESILRLSPVELGWLVDWANALPGLTPVTMDQFWGSSALEQAGLAQVPPAYTLQGRAQILSQAEEIQETLKKQGQGSGWLDGFKTWYSAQYIAAWERFAQAFPGAVDWQRNQDQWHQTTVRMAGPDNPYLQLMTFMGDQLAPYANRRENPSWVAPVMNFTAMRQQLANPQKASMEEKFSKDVSDISNYFNSLSAFVKGRMSSAGGAKQPQDTASNQQAAAAGAAQSGQAGSQPQAGAILPGSLGATTASIKGITPFKLYLDSLRALRESSDTPASSVGLISARFSPPASQPAPPSSTGAPGAPSTVSPFDTADKAVKELESVLGGEDSPLFDELLLGPLRFFWGVGLVDAAAGIQNLWEETVLVKVGQMPKDKLPETLFADKTGLVWGFVDGPAKPFLTRGATGYAAKSVNGSAFPFTKEFLDFINKGSTQTQKIMPNYEVTVTALPTNVNAGAQQEPYATELVLDCQEKVQRLDNFNYPVTQVFKWTPHGCAQTTLTIRFRGFSVTKTYPGSTGFADFLKDFQYDTRKFTPEDFPQSKSSFDLYGVSTVTVQYKLSGGVPVTGLLRVEQFRVPQTITKAWGN